MTASGVRVFKGVPFAAPPVGALRFAPPAAVTPWTAPLDGTVAGSECAQGGSLLGGGVLKASAPFNGVVRAAIVGSAPGMLAVLDAHRAAYPTGGEVTASTQGGVAEIGFAWKKEGAGPLLMMALPHHLDTLVAASKTAASVRTIKGEMIGISGDGWHLLEPLVPITWGAPSGIAAERVPAIEAALAVDADKEKPVAGDAYFYGKQIAKLGRLALIADELGKSAIASALREKMKATLDPWLTGQNEDPLRYDPVWGGVCTAGGLADKGAEFGQGYYNDHHFHYGYFLYAAAALGKGDAAWLASRREAITALARDIANPSASDTAFLAWVRDITRPAPWLQLSNDSALPSPRTM